MRLHAALLAIAASLGAVPLAAQTATACEKRSGPNIAPLVELYTSEGCDSCPPADRWLSTLAQRDDVIALAFHVDYWDRLGWKDRFANASFTKRQYAIQRHTEARFVYTPQVVLNGADWRGWAGGALSSPGKALVDLRLRRDGDRVEADVAPHAGASSRWAAYWAMTEDGHKSLVKAGENRGATLMHDHVVRDYVPVAPWTAAQPQVLRIVSPPIGEGGRTRRVVFVVHEAEGSRPLQALALGC